ncbi:MAG: cytidylate kinase-like family protein [Prevotella sp.]|nr:cytidylate kinase-like family protein [Prevotella sp.]
MENIIINVGRQLGSGGHVVAKKLAEEFGCKFYDKELLNLAAKESGFSEKFFEQNDENRGFLKSLFHLRVPHISDGNFYTNKFSQESLFKFQSDAIRKAASLESCVFVGRCADYILRDYSKVVNVFITADINQRAEQVMKRHQCSKNEALKVIRNAEDERSAYYNYYTGKKWGDSSSYDLCINTSLLGLEETEKFVASFVRRRFNL